MANQNKNVGPDNKDISAKKPAAPNKSSLDSAELQRDQSSQSQKATKIGSESERPMNKPVNNPGGDVSDEDDQDEELEDEDVIEDEDTKATGRHPSQRDRDLK